MDAKILLAMVAWMLVIGKCRSMSENGTGQLEEEIPLDPADMLRQTALGVEMVNAADVQELRARTNANLTHALSNTSLSDLESDNYTQLLQLRYRERKRQERLLVIQAQILQRLRLSRQPNISSNVFSEEEQRRINIIFQRMHDINNNNNNNQNKDSHHHHHPGGNEQVDASSTNPLHSTMQRLQSFYPSCSLPNNTDKATWESPGSFRIYYQMPRSRYFSGSDLTVLLGKLRLYKIATAFGQDWEPNLLELQRYNTLDSPTRSESATGISVSIYQYMRPLRYNRKEKKRLVETRTVNMSQEGWLEFNVISSLNFWLHHGQRNFGFDVEVEDALGNKLNPNLFFRNMNCSASANRDSPFPNLMELHPEMISDNESTLFDNETYPTLDLQTADVSTLNAAAFHLYQPSASSGRFSKRLLKKRHLNHHGQCKAETSYVSFEELGLDDTVVSPEGFQWTFCTGHCPTTSSRTVQPTGAPEPSVSNSGLLKTLRNFWNSLVKESNNDITRCTAVYKRPLSILYYDDHNQLRNDILQDFLPTECACANS